MTQSQAETETLNNHNPTHSDSGHNLINSASDGSETCQNVFQKSSMAFINGSEEEEVIKIIHVKHVSRGEHHIGFYLWKNSMFL